MLDRLLSFTSNSPLLSPTQKWVVFLVTTIHRLSSLLNSGTIYITVLLLCSILLIIFIHKWISTSWRRSDASSRLFLTSGSVLLFAILVQKITIPSSRHQNRFIDHQRDYFYEAWITLQNFTIRTLPNQPLYYSQDGTWYRNEERSSIVRFRGINLPAKTPSFPHDLKSTRPSSNLNHSHEEYMNLLYSWKASVSFVDRPIPLSSADEHFARLSLYGFNLIRLSVPWEAVMPSAAGKIDTVYLSYLSKLVDIAANYGLYVIIDPHQDVWSRFTGGDGAPWWTLSVAGFDMDNWHSLVDTDAAILQASPFATGEPKMQWPTNYGKLAAATMFTLFFAGDVFAPGIIVEDDGCQRHASFWQSVHYTCYEEDPSCHLQQDSTSIEDCGLPISIQSYLRKYYLMFLAAVAQCVHTKPNVIGFNSMNEPSNGFVGLHDLRRRLFGMPFGNLLSTFDGMVLASGETLEGVEYYASPFFKSESKRTLNPLKYRAWKNDTQDIWHRLGIFKKDDKTKETLLLRPHFFSYNGSFMDEFMAPFFHDVHRTVRHFSERFIVFAEPYINCTFPSYHGPPDIFDSDKFAWSPHWYDPTTLLLKRYSRHLAWDLESMRPIISSRSISRSFQKVFKRMRETKPSNIYLLIGETGVPFDITGCDIDDNRLCEEAMDRTLQGIEANNIDYVLWNYCHDNNATDGDHWNGENLSLRVNDGRIERSRGISSTARPYVYQHSSILEISQQTFKRDIKSGHDGNKSASEYKVKVRCRQLSLGHDQLSPSIRAGAFTYIYLPAHQFLSEDIILQAVKVSQGITRYVLSSQTLFWSGLSCPPASDPSDWVSFELSVTV